jgi:hypothetical protein
MSAQLTKNSFVAFSPTNNSTTVSARSKTPYNEIHQRHNTQQKICLPNAKRQHRRTIKFTGSVDKENGNRAMQHNTFDITKRKTHPASLNRQISLFNSQALFKPEVFNLIKLQHSATTF